ncbi:hypothetical protein WN51_03966 [Melipona quadrifasciata]|uniref:Uncharacterized protein n=1 Tax=Melipona quadrifasciata TaxID=166423 RepID=A0A0M8ZPI6_9HYME|nr:hypothetical protein WN51_03966 [Melipona quadrifasciata]
MAVIVSERHLKFVICSMRLTETATNIVTITNIRTRKLLKNFTSKQRMNNQKYKVIPLDVISLSRQKLGEFVLYGDLCSLVCCVTYCGTIEFEENVEIYRILPRFRQLRDGQFHRNKGYSCNI